MKIAIISGLVVVPVNTALVLIFRYAKPAPKKTPMKEYDEQLKFQEKRLKKEEKQRLKQLKHEQELAKGKFKPPPTKKRSRQEDQADPEDHTETAPDEEENITETENLDDSNLVDDKSKIVLEKPKVVRIDTRARKKRFQLPHWFIYVGYILAFITVRVYISFPCLKMIYLVKIFVCRLALDFG